MYRLLISFILIGSFVAVQPAFSSDTVFELAKPKKTSFEVIGSIPPKRHIELDLGKLRTNAASLPDGERDLKARMRLRNRRALERQKAVENAKRDRNEASESEENEVTDSDEKKIAQAPKKKPKIRLKMKNQNKKRKKPKKGKNGAGGSAAVVEAPTQTGPVAID